LVELQISYGLIIDMLILIGAAQGLLTHNHEY